MRLCTAERGVKPSVIWLQLQECTGCSESFVRSSHPAIDDLILDLISLDFVGGVVALVGLAVLSLGI